MKVFTLLLLLSTLTPCYGQSIPTWFNTPHNIKGKLSGKGIGDSLEIAKQNALSDLVNSLTSKVSSATSISTKTIDENVSRTTSASLSLTSNNILLPQIIWHKKELVNQRFYVQALVDIEQFVQNYESQLTHKLSPFNHLEPIKDLNFQQYLSVLKHKPMLSELLLSANAATSFSTKLRQLVQSIQRLLGKADKFSSSQCYRFITPRDTISRKYFLFALQSSLSSEQTIGQSSNCTPIAFKVRKHMNKTGSEHGVNITMEVSLGQPALISKYYNFNGSSTYSMKSALENAAQAFVDYHQQNNGLVSTMTKKDATISF